jgi:hypothetical protein
VAGDLWDYTAVTADSNLVVSLAVGKRTQGQTYALVTNARGRLRAEHFQERPGSLGASSQFGDGSQAH